MPTGKLFMWAIHVRRRSFPQQLNKSAMGISGTWLVFIEGASRLGGAGVINLGQAYWKSSSYADSPPLVIFCILSPCLWTRPREKNAERYYCMLQSLSDQSFRRKRQAVRSSDCAFLNKRTCKSKQALIHSCDGRRGGPLCIPQDVWADLIRYFSQCLSNLSK